MARKLKYKIIILILLVVGVIYIISHIPGYEDLQPSFKTSSETRNWQEKSGEKYSTENPTEYEINVDTSRDMQDIRKASDEFLPAQLQTDSAYDRELNPSNQDAGKSTAGSYSGLDEHQISMRPRLSNVSSYFEMVDLISGKVGEDDSVSSSTGLKNHQDDDSTDNDSAESTSTQHSKVKDTKISSAYAITSKDLKQRFKSAKISPIEKPSRRHQTSSLLWNTEDKSGNESRFYLTNGNEDFYSQSTIFLPKKEDREISEGRENRCYNQSIREPVDHILTVPKHCNLNLGLFDTCKESAKYFTEDMINTSKSCKSKQHKAICNVSMDSENGKIIATCDPLICSKNLVRVKTFDWNLGTLSTKEILIKKKDRLERVVKDQLKLSMKHGFEYILVNCDLDLLREEIWQVLMVPEVSLVRNPLQAIKKPNINVVVIDSVSRKHFYRVLRKTVRQMEIINTNAARESTILDFESFQSLAPFTFVNVQSFMAGKQDFKSVQDRELDFANLLKPYKDSGYQTTLQEDACWYDSWGSILTSCQRRSKELKTDMDLRNAWKALQRAQSRYLIDSSGLSHLSCKVLDMYGRSNMYNRGSHCLNGIPLSSYYLKYLRRRLKQENDKNFAPQFIYTHLNIAHEASGLRIKLIDEQLAEFINDMANLKNTWTILWSDHGAKTTDFSMMSMAGRYEVYDPFLFIITSRRLIDDLPRQYFLNLVRNQWSLLSAQDLHFSMIFLSKYYNATLSQQAVQGSFDKGIFSEHISRANCESLPVREYALCKCATNTQILPYRENKHLVTWLAEFALGSLNNELTSKYDALKRKATSTRSCLRFVGEGSKDVLYSASTSGNRVLIDIIMRGTKRDKKEIFSVHVGETSSNSRYDLKLIHWQRISIYQTFKSCKDYKIPVELCICDGRKRKFPKYLGSYVKLKIFGTLTKLSQINSTCLYKFTRDHSNTVRALELGNFCKDRKLMVNIDKINANGWKLSNKLPTVLNIEPLTIQFVTVGIRLKGKESLFDISTTIL